MTHHVLNARHLLCPLPVIRTQDCVKNLNINDTLAVICTDPGVKNDIPAWCRINGHQLIQVEDMQSEITVTIKVLSK